MKNKRNRIIFSMCLIVLFLCAMLPFLAAQIGDLIFNDTTTYYKMKTVQLYPEVNDIQKLYLLNSETFIPISENRCKLKKADMHEVLEIALKNYTDTNLIRGNLSDFSLECEPFRYYSVAEANLSSTIWVIRMELWDELGQSILVYLDDQEGKILSLSYDCLNPVYDYSELSERIWVLSGIYLSYMDWTYADSNEGIVEQNNDYDEKASSLSYHVGDVKYGEMEIIFKLTRTGFRIYTKQ